MEVTVPGGPPAMPATSMPGEGPGMPEPSPEVAATAVAQPEWSPQQWPQQMPQPWPPQPWPQQMPPPWPAQSLPPEQWQGGGVPSPTWVPAPAASAAPTMAVARKNSGRARSVDLVFGLSMLVAVGGVAFAVGRATAPPSTASNAALAGPGTFPNRSNPNAAVPPAASSAPVVQQQAAPSGAPTIPDAGTGNGNGNGQGNGALPGGGLRAGLTGTVTSVGDGTISYTTAEGQVIQIATTADTTYHQQQAATVADVVVGSSVRISVDGGFGGGFPGTGQPGIGPGAPTASGAPVGGFPGGDAGSLGFTSSNVELVPATDGSTQTQGQGRGFGRGGLTGTVAAVGDGTLSLITADGQTIDVTTTADTTYTQQTDATAADVVDGASIRVTTAGGFGRGQQGASTDTPQTATDIEVLLGAAD